MTSDALGMPMGVRVGALKRRGQLSQKLRASLQAQLSRRAQSLQQSMSALQLTLDPPAPNPSPQHQI